MQDYKQQRPSQEIVAKDLHGVEWRFRHIYRGKFSARISSVAHKVEFIICSYRLSFLICHAYMTLFGRNFKEMFPCGL